MIWDEKYECMSRKDLEEVQLSRLKATVETVYERVPFYKKSFDKSGVKPGDIKSLSDLAKLPFITKSDLRESYPFKMFAVPEVAFGYKGKLGKGDHSKSAGAGHRGQSGIFPDGVRK